MGKIYYHAHKLSGNSDSSSPYYEPWQEGQKITIGENENPFIQRLKALKKSESTNSGHREDYPVEDFLNDIHSGDLDNSFAIRELTFDFLTHYLNLTHELAFELVRVNEFPDTTPSRFKCLWLCESPESAKRWSKTLVAEGKDPQVVKVQITGEILKCDASLLTYRSKTLSKILDNARLYWKGVQDEHVEEEEILFVGSIEVLEVLPQN